MTASPLTIRGLQVRAVDAPLARPIRTAVGAIPSAPLVLIDLQTREGVTGRAYIFGYTPVTLAALVALLDDLAPLLTGQPAAPVAVARAFEDRFRLLGRQGLMGMALWDALGQAKQAPVAELLGGEAKPIPAYDSFGIVDPKDDRAALETSLAQGCKAIKIKIGGGGLAQDIDTVAAVRDIVGPETALMVDYNQSLTGPEAIRRIDRLADYDLLWVEEPVPAEDLAGQATVRAASPIAIQSGENWWFPADMARAIEAGATDYAMPDLMKIGGVTGWIQAMGLAQAASLPVSSHIFVEASAHVMAVTPGAHWLEFLDTAGALMAEPATVTDGSVTPRGPGLGMVWDAKAVARHKL